MLFTILASVLFNLQASEIDSIVSVSIERYHQPCPRDSACVGFGKGEFRLHRMGCEIIPSLEKLYRSDSEPTRRNIAEAATYLGNCSCAHGPLLRRAIKDSSLIVSLEASEAMGVSGCPDAKKQLTDQLESRNLKHRIAAIYGLAKMKKDAVPILLRVFQSPDDSIRTYADSIARQRRPENNPDPIYIAEPPMPVEETKAWLEDAEKYDNTLHGLVQLTINLITGQKMDKDTVRIRAWIDKQSMNRGNKKGKRK